MAILEASGAKRPRERRYRTGFPVRCTAAEKQDIFARAKHARRSASRFLVELALQESTQHHLRAISSEELSALEGLIVQLRRLASNLSELATRQHASAYDDADAPADAEVRKAVQEVRRMLDQIRSRIL